MNRACSSCVSFCQGQPRQTVILSGSAFILGCRIRIHMKVSSSGMRIAIRIKVKIQELWRLIVDPLRAVEWSRGGSNWSHGGSVDCRPEVEGRLHRFEEELDPDPIEWKSRILTSGRNVGILLRIRIKVIRIRNTGLYTNTSAYSLMFCMSICRTGLYINSSVLDSM